MRIDRLLYVRIGVVRFSGEKVRAERVLAVSEQDRHVPMTLEADQQRAIVGDKFSEQCQTKQDEKNPERPIASPVLSEYRETALRRRR